MEIIVTPVIKAIWRKAVDSFSSRVVDQTVDNALNSVQNIADFDAIFENLNKNLKVLSAKAADVDEEINNQERSGRKKRKREVKEWLEEVESIKQVVVELGAQMESEGFVTRLIDGGKAAQLDKQVEKLVEQSRNFGGYVLDVCGTSGDTFLTDGMVGKAFTENLGRIMELLQIREVPSIGVWYGWCGQNGSGKACQQPTHATGGRTRALGYSLSRIYYKKFADKIARRLGVNLSDEDEVDMRATRLHKALSQEKNSVLILDDVWEYVDMKKVGCTFSVECCRLIVTTRSLDVCRRICGQTVIPVEKLGEEEAWKLFNETLGDEIDLVPRVEEIAKSMTKLCGGLPLGIIVVAGSMKGEIAIHAWKNALAELEECVRGQDEIGEVEEVFKVLKYSFDQLKKVESNEFNTLQSCFMYCSLYPEDYAIGKGDLVRTFITEGLLDERRCRRAQVEQGLCILDKLVNVSLLETCVNISSKECVKMHDLVRGMALKIGEGKYMIRSNDQSSKEIYVANKKEWTKDLDKVSLMWSGISRIEDGIPPNCPILSTLLLCWTQIYTIPDSFFSKLYGLCTLNLCSNAKLALLPNSISELKSLKALLLKDCYELENVPYLGKLKALRELNLSGTAIVEVPTGVDELLNLSFLSMDACALEILPRGFFLNLGHLQHLSLPLHMQVDIEEIKSLKLLEEFGGGMKNVSDFNWFITTSGSGLHDPWYRIQVNSKFKTGHSRFRVGGDLLRYYNNELALCNCDLKDEKVLGNAIVDLAVYDCKGLSKWFVDDLSKRFNSPTSLKKLDIRRCRGTEWILRSDCQMSDNLEVIHLVELIELKGLVMERGEIGAFASAAQPPVFSFLKRIIIHGCNKMRKVGLPVYGVPNLEEIGIESCEEIEEIFEEDEGRAASILTTLPKLKYFTLFWLPRLKKVGLPLSGVPNLAGISIRSCKEIEEIFEDEGAAGSITTLPKLYELRLYNLPRLKRVSMATIISNSIHTISITKCPGLMKKLPLHFDDPTPPPFLMHIGVEREWWESLEDWDMNPNLRRLLQPFLHLFL